ncbi:MAG: DUF7133 domain-containing protein, partial [Planctomycetota bacterium]
QGGALPPHYADKLFCIDPLHHKIVLSDIQPAGSTFRTTDIEDVLTSEDTSFRPVAITVGPDGAIYVCDFYEQFIAHGQHYQGQIDPTSGRIYRVRAKDAGPLAPFNLATESSTELIQLFGHPNRWFRQTARRVLIDRHRPEDIAPLKRELAGPNADLALEALWTLHGLKAIDADAVSTVRNSQNATLQSWLARLIGEDVAQAESFANSLSSSTGSAEADLRLAAASRNLPLDAALTTLKNIVNQEAYASDTMLPLVAWWAFEARVEEAPQAVIDALLAVSNAPLVQNHLLPNLMRRFAATGARQDLIYCAQLLDRVPTAQHRKALMGGFDLAMAGKTSVTLPDRFVEVMSKHGVGGSIMLNVRRGDVDAVNEALKLIANPKAKPIERLQLIATFGQVDQPRAIPVLLKIATSKQDAQARKAALAALMRYDDPSIAPAVLRGFGAMSEEIRAAALNLLTSRASGSLALLGAYDAGRIDPIAIGQPVIDKLRLHNSPPVKQLVDKLFPQSGTARKPSQLEFARVKSILDEGVGRPYEGKAVYMQSCGACHTLFHHGSDIGPSLTTYQRTDLDTMLFSIVDPSAEIREGYQMRLITTSDGRSLSGFLTDQSPDTLSLRGLDGQDIAVSRGQITSDTPLPGSLMPPGLLAPLTDEQLRDLFAYLMSAQPMTK